MANIINLTPHEVSIIADGKVKATFPSEGVARATQTVEVVDSLNGIDIVSMRFGKTEGLPTPVDGTYYIVSITTANAARAEGRTCADLLVTSGPVRGNDGQIIGCTALARI